MTLVEQYASERQARLVRLGARPQPKPSFKPIDPTPFYRHMWMWDLVSPGPPPPELEPRVSLGQVTDTVCKYFLVQKRELFSPRVTAELTYPRQICYYLARKLTFASSAGIGRHFCRDHSTVLYGDKKIRRLIRDNWEVAFDIAHLEAMF